MKRQKPWLQLAAGKEQMDEVWDLAVLSIFLWLPREKKKKKDIPCGIERDSEASAGPSEGQTSPGSVWFGC